MNWLGFALRFVLRASSARDPIQGVKHPPNFAQALALAILSRSSLSYSRHPTREYITPMLSSRPFRSFLTCFVLNLQTRLPGEISPLEPVLTEIAAGNSPRMNTYAKLPGRGYRPRNATLYTLVSITSGRRPCHSRNSPCHNSCPASGTGAILFPCVSPQNSRSSAPLLASPPSRPSPTKFVSRTAKSSTASSSRTKTTCLKLRPTSVSSW